MSIKGSLVETLEILDKGKIPLANYEVLEDKKDLKNLTFPIYIKIDSQKHKSKIGGVRRCNNQEEAMVAIKYLLRKFPKNLLLLQEEIKGREIFVGIKKDKIFGKILVVGAGGTKVESKKDLSFRALPVKRTDIKRMIRELKIYRELRKENKKALKGLVTLIKNTSHLAKKLKFKELDLNPVILTSDGAFIVDARII
jgi:succinyl-CoA synthetase beta subunit